MGSPLVNEMVAFGIFVIRALEVYGKAMGYFFHGRNNAEYAEYLEALR